MILLTKETPLKKLGPPGPPPKPGWEWHEETKRWRNPENWEESVEHTPTMVLPTRRPKPSAPEGVRELGNAELEEWAARVLQDEHLTFMSPATKFIPARSRTRDQSNLQAYMEMGYLRVNESLRTGGALLGTDAEIRDSLVGMMESIEDDMLVFRGQDMLKEEYERLLAGEELALDAFTSTSRSPKVAMGFARAAPRGEELVSVLFQVGLPPDAQAIIVDTDEHETILNLGQKLRLVEQPERVWYDGGVIHVVPVEVVEERDELMEFMVKAPPGPPPRPGLVWWEETSRWRRPKDASVEELTQAILEVYSESQADAMQELMELNQSHPEVAREVVAKVTEAVAKPKAEQSVVRQEGWQRPRGGYSERFEPGQPVDQPRPHVYSKEDLQGEERYALGAYTSIVSEALNRNMREAAYGGAGLSELSHRVMDPMLSMAKALGEDVHTVYRGFGGGVDLPQGHVLAEELEVGQQLPIDSFMSTSRDPMMAKRFAGQAGMLMEIHPGEDTRGIILGNNFDNRAERETIFMPGQYLVVREVHQNVPSPDYSRQPVGRYIVATLHTQPQQELSKAAPGPPPRPGLVWYEETKRWRRPRDYKEPREEKPQQESSEEEIKRGDRVRYEQVIHGGKGSRVYEGEVGKVGATFTTITLDDGRSMEIPTAGAVKVASASPSRLPARKPEPGGEAVARQVSDPLENTWLEYILDEPEMATKLDAQFRKKFNLGPTEPREYADEWASYEALSGQTQSRWQRVVKPGVPGRSPMGLRDIERKLQEGDERFEFYGGALMEAGVPDSVVKQMTGEMMEVASPLGVDMPLYRGMQLHPEQLEQILQQGHLAIDKPTSTSMGMEIPWIFSDGDVMLEIKGAENAPVLTENQDQAEVVLMPGGQLNILHHQVMPRQSRDFVRHWIVAEYVA